LLERHEEKYRQRADNSNPKRRSTATSAFARNSGDHHGKVNDPSWDSGECNEWDRNQKDDKPNLLPTQTLILWSK
jgi:hypothetical protein